MKLANYELLDIIGEGGFGLVYRAKQLSTGQTVAIKVLKFDGNISEQKKQHQIARFDRETQLSAQLNHPHIVKLLDKGTTEDNRMYAVFEYVEGQTLKELVIEKNGLTPTETGDLMGQILDGLASAHAQGIVHRDLKPTNIMVAKTGLKAHAKILDFGIGAFTASFQPKDYALLTLTKETIGTPAYSAPEQLRGEPPTTKSDLYAWGLILLECLTGAPVMRGESVGEVFEQQLNANQVALPTAIAEHPLGKLLRNVLEKNPLHRSADAHRIAEEYSRINFQTLVGKIQMPQTVITDADVTSVTDFGLDTQKSERRQITVLSVQLSIAITEESDLDEEVLDTLQEDQMALTTEIATRYGGYLAGSVADTITVYFGYPQKSENDARYAGRTALELISQAKKRSALMHQQHGVELDMRMGMHSGTVLLKKNTVPKGLIPNTAFALMNRAESDSVLVSGTTKTLLDPYLEFEPSGKVKLSKFGKPEESFSLKGERPSEALSFLRPWSANRQMVGRDTELKLIKDVWRKLDMGHGQAVLTRGQAGIGKSKLVHEAKRQFGNDGAAIKEVRCLPEHRNNALYPFFEMLKKHASILDLDETTSKIIRLRELLQGIEVEVDQILPILCSWLSIPLDETVTGSQLPPDQQKALLMQSLHTLLVHLGKQKKYVLVVEDLHWMDPTSQELLQNVLGALATTQVLVLMTTRPEFKPEWEYQGLQVLELQPLDQDRTRRMILGVLDGNSVDDKLVKYVSERADGVPLFIEELTHMLLDREFLVMKDDTYQLDETRDMSSVPVRLNDLLNARLDKLGFAKETAQLAATIGREFAYDLLVQASLKDEASVQADLQALAQADMVYHQRRVEGDSYIFRHALIRDAAYEGMANKEREASHQHIAEVLEGSFPHLVEQSPFLVASHHENAGQYQRAFPHYYRHLERLVALAQYDLAISTAQKLIGWSEEEKFLIDPNGLLSIHFQLILALQERYGWSGDMVSEQLSKTMAIMQKTGPTQLDIPILWSAVSFYHVGSQREEARRVTEQLKAIVEHIPDPELQSSIQGVDGIMTMAEGNYSSALKLLKSSLEGLEQFAAQKKPVQYGFDMYAYVAASLGLASTIAGNIEDGLKYGAIGVDRARDLDHKPSLGISLMYAGLSETLNGNEPRVMELTGELLELGQKFGMPAYVGYAGLMFNWATENLEAIDGIVHTLDQLGCRLALSMYPAFAADIAMKRDNVEMALDRIESCLAFAERYNEHIFEPELLRLKATYLLAKKPAEIGQVKDVLKQAISMGEEYGMSGTVSQAEELLLSI